MRVGSFKGEVDYPDEMDEDFTGDRQSLAVGIDNPLSKSGRMSTNPMAGTLHSFVNTPPRVPLASPAPSPPHTSAGPSASLSAGFANPPVGSSTRGSDQSARELSANSDEEPETVVRFNEATDSVEPRGSAESDDGNTDLLNKMLSGDVENNAPGAAEERPPPPHFGSSSGPPPPLPGRKASIGSRPNSRPSFHKATSSSAKPEWGQMEVFQNERYSPLLATWGSTYPGHLLPTDRAHFSDETGNKVGQQYRAPLGRTIEVLKYSPLLIGAASDFPAPPSRIRSRAWTKWCRGQAGFSTVIGSWTSSTRRPTLTAGRTRKICGISPTISTNIRASVRPRRHVGRAGASGFGSRRRGRGGSLFRSLHRWEACCTQRWSA